MNRPLGDSVEDGLPSHAHNSFADRTPLGLRSTTGTSAAPLMVVFGTTLGMLIADVFVRDKLESSIPMRLVDSIASAVFAMLGLTALLGAGSTLSF